MNRHIFTRLIEGKALLPAMAILISAPLIVAQPDNACHPRRYGKFSEWSKPVNLGPVVNASGNDQWPAISPNGLSLYFGSNRPPAASSEIYDPVTGTFSASGDMTRGRELQKATLLRSGQVLITGGNGLSSAEIYTPAVLIPAPALLSLSGDGRGQGAILHGNTSQLASPDNPAAVGEVLEIYLTGLPNGSLIQPQVSIGGRMADVLWFGNNPGYSG